LILRSFEVEFELKSAEFDRKSDQFWLVLTGNLEKSRKVPKNPLKIVFLRLPSVKHLKKYEKGGFLEFSLDIF